MPPVRRKSTEVPDDVLHKWQGMTDLLGRLAGVPVALVMRVVHPKIEVFVSSATKGNPYHEGESEHLAESGLYCEEVIKSRSKLLVPNALADPQWQDNPDIKFGLISYLGFPILKPNGEVFGTLCVLDNKENSYSPDIEELMLKFKDLLESHLALLMGKTELNAVLRGITSETEDLIAAQDQEFRYLFFNNAYQREFKRLWGINLDMGMSMIECLAPWPHDQRKAVELWTRAMSGESFKTLVEFGPSGKRRQVYELQFNPIHDTHGVQIGAAHIIRNMTERLRMEQALQESEKRLRLALDAAYQIMFEWNIPRDEVRRFVSRETALAPTPDDRPVTFEDVVNVIHPDDQDHFRAKVHAALEHVEGEYESEFRLVRPDGEVVWLYERGRVERDANGQPYRLIGLSQDVTERKRTAQALEEAKEAADKASQAKSDFLANMSHEIRTPMTVFMAAVEHLLQTDRNPERRHLLGMADQSAKRLRSLIDDILDISRIEARKVEIEEAPFDLRECIREAVEMFALAAREKGLQLEMEIEKEVPRTVIGDPGPLGQVLINLIGNAVKFTHEGMVRVCVRPRGTVLEFSVIDTGIGIPEDKLDLLFQSFSQVDASFTRQYGGTGLGLAISKGLVELMGGEISVQSGKREGSVFTFSLPLKSAKQSCPAPVAATAAAPEELQSAARILLAEDDSMIRELITIMLSRKGLQIDTAETGGEALEKWASGKFDLILMDLQMPEMNGLEATRSIREKEAAGEKRTCIIGLTAHARREIKDECLQAGMDRVLTKPVQIKDLYSAIDDCLAV